MIIPPKPSRVRRIVPIVVFAVLIIGIAGILIFSRISNQSKAAQDDSANIPAKVCDSGTASVFFMASEGFGAKFPCEPLQTVQDVKTVMGTLSVTHYAAETGNSRYDLLYTDYSAFFGGELNGIVRSIVLNRFKEASMTEFNATETSAKAIKLGTLEGEEVIGANDKRSVRFQVFVVGKKLFRIAVVAPNADIKAAHHTEFLASLKIEAEK
jgi:hypothetical protein